MYHNRFLDVIKVSCVVIIIYLLYLFGLPSASSASTTIKQQPTNIIVRGKHDHRTFTLSISTSTTNQTNSPAPKQTIREHNIEPWFFIKRGAGCFEIEISKNINIVIFVICKNNNAAQLFQLNQHQIITKTNTNMCLSIDSTKQTVIIEKCLDLNHPKLNKQLWYHTQYNKNAAKSRQAGTQYTSIRLHTKIQEKKIKCITLSTLTPTPTSIVSIKNCADYISQHNFKDRSTQTFYFVKERNNKFAYLIVLPSDLVSVSTKVDQFRKKTRQLYPTTPIIFIHTTHWLNTSSKDDSLHLHEFHIYDNKKNTDDNNNNNNNNRIINRVKEILESNQIEKIVTTNIDGFLTSESDLEILSNTLENNPTILAAGGYIIGKGNVLHRNCYTAVDVDNTNEIEWVAGYHDTTKPTMYNRKCMVCDRIAKPLLIRSKDISVILQQELDIKETITNWKNVQKLWIQSISTSRLATCAHFVTTNHAFEAKASMLHPPDSSPSLTTIHPITKIWKKTSPCRKEPKKNKAMWNMLKYSIQALQKNEDYNGVLVQSGLLMQTIKLGTIAPWDHDLDLDISLKHCGTASSNIHGPGSDITKGCTRFVPTIKKIVNSLTETKAIGKPDGFGADRWLTSKENRGWANIRMELEFYFRATAWADICTVNKFFQLMDTWEICLKKLRDHSIKHTKTYKKSRWLQMDLHLKFLDMKHVLWMDLVGYGEIDEEIRVGVYYNAKNLELWHMEYIDLGYGSSYLDHPWECEWKCVLHYV